MNYELQTISCIWFEILQYPACWTIHSPCILSSECPRLCGRYTVSLPAFSIFCLFLQCCRIAPVPARGSTCVPIPGAVLSPVPDHSSYPAVLLPDRMSVYRFLCKPVLAILLSFYSIIVFSICLPLKVALPIYVCLRAKILLLFLLLFSNINSVQRGCCSWRCPQFSTQSQQKTNLEIRFFSPQIYIVKADSERTKLP